MKKTVYILTLTTLVLAACGNQGNTGNPENGNNNALNLDAIPGIYSAVMPCEGCQSRRVLITLRPDHSGTHTDIWIKEGNPNSEISDCTWQWNDTTKHIEIRNTSDLKLDLELQSDSALTLPVAMENKSIVFRKQKAILNKSNELIKLTPEQQRQALREHSPDTHVKASETKENIEQH
jgi:hypothetical protein